eukprot:jgi/Psemu1/20601/gm1.20601_g
MAPPTRAQLAATAAAAVAEAEAADAAETEAAGNLMGLLPPSVTTRLDPEQLEQLTVTLVARLSSRNISLSTTAREAKERAEANDEIAASSSEGMQGEYQGKD